MRLRRVQLEEVTRPNRATPFVDLLPSKVYERDGMVIGTTLLSGKFPERRSQERLLNESA